MINVRQTIGGTSSVVQLSSDIVANFQKAMGKLTKGMAAGLSVIANDIMVESMRRTPVEFGVLRGGHYNVAGGSDAEPWVEVGVTANYGPYVHENLEAKHTTGEAKFLENAVAAKTPGVPHTLRKYMAKGL